MVRKVGQFVVSYREDDRIEIVTATELAHLLVDVVDTTASCLPESARWSICVRRRVGRPVIENRQRRSIFLPLPRSVDLCGCRRSPIARRVSQSAARQREDCG